MLFRERDADGVTRDRLAKTISSCSLIVAYTFINIFFSTVVFSSYSFADTDLVVALHTTSKHSFTPSKTISTISEETISEKTVSEENETFSSTTLTENYTSNELTFTNLANIELNKLITSNSITVSSINSSTAISIIGGQYSIAGSSFTPDTRTINDGDTVRVRHTSADEVSTTTNTTLTIGNRSYTFSTTTLASDTNPDAFEFLAQSNVALNELITSNNFLVSSITDSAPISISGGQYNINGGTFTQDEDMVNAGDNVTVRHTSSNHSITATDTVLTIGKISTTFTSLTLSADKIPTQFKLIDKLNVPLRTTSLSNNFIVTGINSLTPISVTGGEYSVNGNAYTTTKGEVSNIDSVIVRHISSESNATETSTTLTIGEISDTFSSTTLPISTVNRQIKNTTQLSTQNSTQNLSQNLAQISNNVSDTFGSLLWLVPLFVTLIQLYRTRRKS